MCDYLSSPRAARDCEGFRQHPKHTHATHQVTMFKRAVAVGHEVVGMQAARDAASHQVTMHSTNDGK